MKYDAGAQHVALDNRETDLSGLLPPGEEELPLWEMICMPEGDTLGQTNPFAHY